MTLKVKIFKCKNDIQKLKENILGVIEYGTRNSEEKIGTWGKLPHQFVQVKNQEESYYEVWYCSEQISYYSREKCVISLGNKFCFMSVTIKEKGDYQEEAETAYQRLFQELDLNTYRIVRFWNYIPQISRIKNGKEKYREFCSGREKAFTDKNFNEVEGYPAATGIGCEGNFLCISLLAVSKSLEVKSLENPRQVPAYEYPSRYGLSSPKFARAMYVKNESEKYILVSGTASIVGADTVHVNDVEKQTMTTIENIFLLISQNNLQQYGIKQFKGDRKLIKVYIRHWKDYPLVKKICEEKFGEKDIIYLQCDICRKDLLVEIEAVVSQGGTE